MVQAGHRIDVVGLTKRFGAVTALDDLTFSVRPGVVTGFLGPNGAGKTTTLRCLLGLVEPTDGTATIDGRPYREIADPLGTVGAALEASSFHPGRSARSHLEVMALAAGVPVPRVEELLRMVGLSEFARRRVSGYSLGMRQRLGLAQALLGDPPVLILDEPANGLDPAGIAWLRGLLRSLAGEGRTVLISSHVLSEVQQSVDDVVVIARGKLVRQGTLTDLEGGPAAVLVRTPTPEALREALGASYHVTEEGGRFRVVGSTTDEVGHLAHQHGIELHELATEASDLEKVFLAMTSDEEVPSDPKPFAGLAGLTRVTVQRGLGMSGAPVRSELRKISSTRLWWGLLIGVAVYTAISAAASAAFAGVATGGGQPQSAPLSSPEAIRTVYASAAFGGAYIFAMILGITGMTGEYRYQTITSTFLATPRRARIVLSKMAALVGYGLGYGAFAAVVALAVGGVVISIRGFGLGYGTDRLWSSILLGIVAVALWTLVGLGIGTLIRNQIAAILVAVFVVFLVESIATAVLAATHHDEVAKWLPTNASNALTSPGSATVDYLPWWAGGLVLLGYAVVLAGIGLLLSARRDVT